MPLRDTFLHGLSSMVGQECWDVIGGAGTGSIISLRIGGYILFDKQLNTPHLSEAARQYDSIYALMILCPWRIDSPSAVLSASYMPNSNAGPMVNGFSAIRGQCIKALHCTGPAFDLRLEFENQNSLLIQCGGFDQDYEECYTFTNPDGHYTVSLNGNLTFEP